MLLSGFPESLQDARGLSVALLSPTSRFPVLGSSEHKTGGCGVAWSSGPSSVACQPVCPPSAPSVGQQAQGGPCHRGTCGSLQLSRRPECWPWAVVYFGEQGSNGRTRPPEHHGAPRTPLLQHGDGCLWLTLTLNARGLAFAARGLNGGGRWAGGVRRGRNIAA